MPGRYSRNKGAQFERDIVNDCRRRGLAAERIPLSGAMGGSFGGDVRLTICDRTLKIECKILANGFKFLYDKLSGNDALVIRADRKDPLIVMTLSSYLDTFSPKESKTPESATEQPGHPLPDLRQ